MIEHVWSVLCSRSVIDQDSNNVSIQNVIEEIEVVGEPEAGALLSVRLEVTSLWITSTPEGRGCGKIRVTFTSPSGQVAEPFLFDLNLSNTERSRTRMRFQGIPATESGRHYFKVELLEDGVDEWRQVAAIPLTIRYVPKSEEDIVPDDK